MCDAIRNLIAEICDCFRSPKDLIKYFRKRKSSLTWFSNWIKKLMLKSMKFPTWVEKLGRLWFMIHSKFWLGVVHDPMMNRLRRFPDQSQELNRISICAPIKKILKFESKVKSQKSKVYWICALIGKIPESESRSKEPSIWELIAKFS